MEDGELNSFIEGLSNTNQGGQLVLTQQLQQQNPQTHFVVSPYATNTYLSSSESPFPTPSPSPSIILRSPAPVKSPITNLQNMKSPIPVKSPGFQNVKSPNQNFQNVKSPNQNFQNVKSPNLYQVKSPGISNIKSPASGIVKSPANTRSPGVCNPQSPAQSHSPFPHQVGGSPSSNRSPAPPPPTPSPTAPSPARPNTPQPVMNQYPPNAQNTNQLSQFSQAGQVLGRTQLTYGGLQAQIQKTKQPLQILPKPLTGTAAPQKQTVPRLNAASISQQTPLIINQSENASPALVLNQVLTSGAPVLVQPAGPGGTVHLMLRPPTPTLQSGPGPPSNKMIITNAPQPQAQAAVLIPNRQQVMRIMTAQGPMQIQPIQTPSGPQFIAIPQNQALSFPPNSVLLQSSPPNTIQVQPNGANTIQLQQNPPNVLQSGNFPPSSLPITTNQIALQNQILQTNISSPNVATSNKRDEKAISTESLSCSVGGNEQKKIVIDNKNNNKKNTSIVTCNNNNNNNNNLSNSNVNIGLSSMNNAPSTNITNVNVQNKKNKSGKGKNEEESLNKNFTKSDAVVGQSVSTSPAQKNITSSLRQIRPGAFANRNKQNQNSEFKDKTGETNSKSLTNLTRIIDSVASNTEHLLSTPPPKIDNLTATINSVAENSRPSVSDEILSNLSFSDVFIPGNKTLSLNKRPNLTIVQKQSKAVPPDPEEASLTINRLILSPNSHSSMDFSNISESYDALEMGGIMTSAGVQTSEGQNFLEEQNSSSNVSVYASSDDLKKGKKKANIKKKGKKEENRVDLWDLMKSAGIGDDEFDETNDVDSFAQDSTKMSEGLEISPTDTELLAQLQTATQIPNNIRLIVGEDGRPVFFNGGNVLVPDTVQSGAPACAVEPSDADSILQNMILPDNVFNFTPQALATAQTQLNQLIQDHTGIPTPTSSDQQLLSQIFGPPSSNNNNNNNNNNNCNNAGNSNLVTNVSNLPTTMQSTTTTLSSSTQNRTSLTGSGSENMMVNVASNNSEVSQMNSNSKQEVKSDFDGCPDLPPLGPDSLVITNNNGVPTLVASPALMQYLQTHQGIIQFQHDPVTKTIQPSLIIPHPQPKAEITTPTQPERNDKFPRVVANARNISQNKEVIINKPRTEQKSSVGTTTEEPKTIAGTINVTGPSQAGPGLLKLNMVKFVKDNPPLLQIATETNNLISYKENNNLTEKEIVDIERKIQQNRSILDQFFVMEHNRSGQNAPASMSNVIVKEGMNKKNKAYQVGNFAMTLDKFGNNVSVADKTTETQTVDDLQHIDTIPVKTAQPISALSSPSPHSDFQTKFLESIGMANKVTKTSIGTGTTSSPNNVAPVNAQTSPVKRGRRKKERNQNQATQVEGKMEMTFNIAQLTPEQNLKLNQALQSRGVTANHVHNFDAIKQIIQEEIRKITSGTLQNASIRFVNAPSSQQTEEATDTSERNVSAPGTLFSNQSVNPMLDQSSNQGNIISLQGNDVLSLNNGNQRILTSQNQLLTSGHLVTSNNPILAIGGNPNQIVTLGNPINSANQIVTLGNPSNLMSVNGNNLPGPGPVIVGSNGNVVGNNLPGPGSVIVGSNGNVVAIVHQTPVSGQGSGIVQRLQTIQLTAPKQQHFKTIQNQIQTLNTKSNRTATEQATLQKLVLEQQKILSTGRLVSTAPGSFPQGMQIVPQPITGQSNRMQSSSSQQSQQNQTQQSQTVPLQQQNQMQPMYSTANGNTNSSQSSKTNYTTQTAVSCGTNTLEVNGSTSTKLTVPSTVMISDTQPSNYGPLYVNPNASSKNVTKCEKGTSPIQIQMGTQTGGANVECKSGKMSTGTMTSPNTGKPQAVVAPAIVIQQTEAESPTWQLKQRNQSSTSPLRTHVPVLNRIALIEQQMRADQAGATMPDTQTPFLSKSDACKRLIRYHVMEEKALTSQDLATADEIFEATAQHLLDKFRIMKEKYKYLLMMESMREVSTAERIMVDRNFIIEERIELEELREKEKRLQEEFNKSMLSFSAAGDATVTKTELTYDEGKAKKNTIESLCSEEVKFENDEGDLISKGKNMSDNQDDVVKDNSFRISETNGNLELSPIKYETKEYKNARATNSSQSAGSPENDDLGCNISNRCKIKNNRTLSDISSKSSLDSGKDEDSGTDINAQVQSAIDSILNLQKCETMSNSADDCVVPSKKKMKRKHTDRSSDSLKRMRAKDYDGSKKDKNSSDESDYDDGCGSDADTLLDEAIRSIMTS